MDAQYAIEKFTRCPKCRSFSLKGVNPNGEDRGSERSICTVYACRNCGDQYVLHGDTLKKKNSFLFSKNHDLETMTDEPEIPERPKQEPVIPRRVERKKKTYNRTAVSLISILILAALGFLFFLYPGIKKQDHEELAPPLGMEETKQVEETVVEEPQATVEEDTEAVDNTETTTAMEETTENDAPADEAIEEDVRAISENEQSDETIPEEPETTAAVETVQRDDEPVSYKVFDSSLVKVRKSSPDYSDRSRRWFFKRNTITISRSEEQRVYIAGDATGKRKWAVDDEITINGRRVKGVSDELSVVGYIPESKQVQPLDITELVPPGKDTVLDIRLVDYGIFWGNTPVYVVII